MSGGEILNDEKEYRLSKLEQETIIIFNEEEDDATIETCNRSNQGLVLPKHRNFTDREVGIENFYHAKSILTYFPAVTTAG